MKMCNVCGQLRGISAYDSALWDIYSRIDDSRSHREPLVFYSDNEHHYYDDDYEHQSMTLAMEKDMHERGLCTECGRPDLRGVKPEMILSPEEARENAECHAEMEAERRAGC